jgi:hypothetical protein
MSDRAAAEGSAEGLDYDRDSDVLDVYFGDRRRACTIELTENITVSIDRLTEKAISLTFLDFSLLARPTASGARSFPIIGLPSSLDLSANSSCASLRRLLSAGGSMSRQWRRFRIHPLP